MPIAKGRIQQSVADSINNAGSEKWQALIQNPDTVHLHVTNDCMTDTDAIGLFFDKIITALFIIN